MSIYLTLTFLIIQFIQSDGMHGFRGHPSFPVKPSDDSLPSPSVHSISKPPLPRRSSSSPMLQHALRNTIGSSKPPLPRRSSSAPLLHHSSSSAPLLHHSSTIGFKRRGSSTSLSSWSSSDELKKYNLENPSSYPSTPKHVHAHAPTPNHLGFVTDRYLQTPPHVVKAQKDPKFNKIHHKIPTSDGSKGIKMMSRKRIREPIKNDSSSDDENEDEKECDTSISPMKRSKKCNNFQEYRNLEKIHEETDRELQEEVSPRLVRSQVSPSNEDFQLF